MTSRSRRSRDQHPRVPSPTLPNQGPDPSTGLHHAPSFGLRSSQAYGLYTTPPTGLHPAPTYGHYSGSHHTASSLGLHPDHSLGPSSVLPTGHLPFTPSTVLPSGPSNPALPTGLPSTYPTSGINTTFTPGFNYTASISGLRPGTSLRPMVTTTTQPDDANSLAESVVTTPSTTSRASNKYSF